MLSMTTKQLLTKLIPLPLETAAVTVEWNWVSLTFSLALSDEHSEYTWQYFSTSIFLGIFSGSFTWKFTELVGIYKRVS